MWPGKRHGKGQRAQAGGHAADEVGNVRGSGSLAQGGHQRLVYLRLFQLAEQFAVVLGSLGIGQFRLRAKVLLYGVHQLFLAQHVADDRGLDAADVCYGRAYFAEAVLAVQAEDSNPFVHQAGVACRQIRVGYHVDLVEGAQVVGGLGGQAAVAVVFGFDFIGGRRAIEHDGIGDGTGYAQLDGQAGGAGTVPAEDNAVGDGPLVDILAAVMAGQLGKSGFEQVCHAGLAFAGGDPQRSQIATYLLGRATTDDVFQHWAREEAGNPAGEFEVVHESLQCPG